MIRRALTLYVEHLQTLQDCSAEVKAVHRACGSLRVAQEDQQAARERLEAADAAPHPLPSFVTLLLGPEAIARIEDLDARAEAYAKAISGVSHAAKRKPAMKVRASAVPAADRATAGPLMPTYLKGLRP